MGEEDIRTRMLGSEQDSILEPASRGAGDSEDDCFGERIRMEVLRPREVTFVIVAMWAAIIGALVLNVFEEKWLKPFFTTSSSQCFDQLSGPVCASWEGLDCAAPGQMHSTVSGNLSGVTTFNSFFLLRGQVELAANTSGACAGHLLGCWASYSVRMVAWNSAGNGSRSEGDTQAYENYDLGVGGGAGVRSNESMRDVHEWNMTTQFICPGGGDTCEVADMLVWGGPLSWDTYEITIRGLSVRNSSFCEAFGEGAKLSMSISMENGTKVFAETVLRLVLLEVALFALCYWLRCLSVVKQAWLPEQWWITFGLCALVLLQDPVYALKIQHGGVWLTVSMATLALAVSLFLGFWLLLVDSMGARSSKTYSLLFYAPKLAFMVAYFFAGFAKLYCSSVFQLQGFAVDGGRVISLDVLSESGGYAVLLWAALTWGWLVWFWFKIFHTRAHLRSLPYLETRFRQLSFSFFQLQSAIVSVYLVADMAISLLWSDSFVMLNTLNYNGFPQALLFEVYTLLVAFVYLPAEATHRRALGPLFLPSLLGRKGRTLRRNNFVVLAEELVEEGAGDLFCLQLAHLAVHASLQAYYDPPEERTPSGWGVVNSQQLSGLGLRVRHFVYRPEADIAVLLIVQEEGGAGGGRRVFVACRGSSSVSNALTDLNIARVRVPADRWIPRCKSVAQQMLQGLKGTVQTVLHPVEGLERGAASLLRALSGVRVHAGFWLAYEAVAEEVLTALAEDEGLRGEVVVTGHSLGGAVGQLLALDLRMRLGADASIALYTFGSPRVGNASFAGVFSSAVPRGFRVVFRNDIVSTMPGPPLFVHGGQEVIMDDKGHLRVDPSFVERVFRPSRRSVTDHTMASYIRALDACLTAHRVHAR